MSINKQVHTGININTLNDKTDDELVAIGRQLNITSAHLFKRDNLIDKIKIGYYELLHAEEDRIQNQGLKISIPEGEKQKVLEGQAFAPGELSRDEKLDRHIEYHTRLIRVQIYCLNPNKQDLPGELHTVYIPHVGEITRWVPYNEDFCRTGYHIEKCILDCLEDKTFQTIQDEEGTERGFRTTHHVGHDRKEFRIIEVPSLTKEQLAELALKQSQSQRIEG